MVSHLPQGLTFRDIIALDCLIRYHTIIALQSVNTLGGGIVIYFTTWFLIYVLENVAVAVKKHEI